MQDDDLIFETILHHKEIEKTLQGISVGLSERSNEDITTALENQTKAVNEFAKAIHSIPVPPAPEVNVTLDQQKVVDSIAGLANSILNGQKAITEALSQQTEGQKATNKLLKDVLSEVSKKREWEFHFKKTESGEIISSTARQIK